MEFGLTEEQVRVYTEAATKTSLATPAPSSCGASTATGLQ